MRAGVVLLLTSAALSGCQIDDDFAACKSSLSAIRLTRSVEQREQDSEEQGWFVETCMGSRGYAYRIEDETCAKYRFDPVMAPQSCFEPRGLIRSTRLILGNK